MALRAFSNLGVTQTWEDQDIKRWYRIIMKDAEGVLESPSPVNVERAYGLKTTDCVVFSLQVEREMETRGGSPAQQAAQQVHTGDHGASIRQDNEPSTLVVVDSSARHAFAIEEGKQLSFPLAGRQPIIWRLNDDKLSDGRGRLFEPAKSQEAWDRTNVHQWRQKNVIVLFREWEGQHGTFGGRITFKFSEGKVQYSAVRGGPDPNVDGVRVLSDIESARSTMTSLDEFVKHKLPKSSLNQWRD
ncbi:MAG: cytokinesis protein 3 [Chaenotheca gracillima]|nr:MAG: cytokinesis protein 3 [Chaenotheca gracillima]